MSPGRIARTRDETKEAFVSLRETDAWRDDEGFGHYVLECCPSTGRSILTGNWSPGWPISSQLA